MAQLNAHRNDDEQLIHPDEFPAGIGSHASVERADPYSFQVAHRRQAWLLRISAGTNIVLAFSLASAINAWAVLWPLKETEIALIRTDSTDDRTYRIEPLSKGVDGFDLMLESKARLIVRLLLPIDAATQTERFKEAFRFMDGDFFDRFEEEQFARVESALASGLNRSITVESANRIESSGNIYKFAVDFVQTDERKGKIVEQLKLRAYVNITPRPKKVKEKDKYENPLGITVLDLVLKERGNS